MLGFRGHGPISPTLLHVNIFPRQIGWDVSKEQSLVAGLKAVLVPQTTLTAIRFGPFGKHMWYNWQLNGSGLRKKEDENWFLDSLLFSCCWWKSLWNFWKATSHDFHWHDPRKKFSSKVFKEKVESTKLLRPTTTTKLTRLQLKYKQSFHRQDYMGQDSLNIFARWHCRKDSDPRRKLRGESCPNRCFWKHIWQEFGIPYTRNLRNYWQDKMVHPRDSELKSPGACLWLHDSIELGSTETICAWRGSTYRFQKVAWLPRAWSKIKLF